MKKKPNTAVIFMQSEFPNEARIIKHIYNKLRGNKLCDKAQHIIANTTGIVVHINDTTFYKIDISQDARICVAIYSNMNNFIPTKRWSYHLAKSDCFESLLNWLKENVKKKRGRHETTE